MRDLESRLRGLESNLAQYQRMVQITEDETVVVTGNFQVNSPDGRPIVSVSEEGGTASITLYNEMGRVAVNIGSSHEGQFNGILVHDRTGKIVSRLQTLDDEGVIFSLYGRHDDSGLSLAVLEEGGKFVLKNADGEIVASLPAEKARLWPTFSALISD